MRRVAAPIGLSLALALALAWGAAPAWAEDPLQGLGLDRICQDPSASADLPADQAQALRDACAEVTAAQSVDLPPAAMATPMAIPDDGRPVEQQLDDLRDKLESLDGPP
jgi:hypothetical protein